MPYISIGMLKLNTLKKFRSNTTLTFRSPDIHTTQTVAEYATLEKLFHIVIPTIILNDLLVILFIREDMWVQYRMKEIVLSIENLLFQFV